jgi:hypothetical protein
MLKIAHILFLAILVLQFGLAAVFIWLQAGALRRHRRRSFELLLTASICAVAATIVSLCLSTLPQTEQSYLWGVVLMAVFAIGNAVFNVSGLMALLRDYRRLEEHFAATATEGKKGMGGF